MIFRRADVTPSVFAAGSPIFRFAIGNDTGSEDESRGRNPGLPFEIYGSFWVLGMIFRRIDRTVNTFA